MIQVEHLSKHYTKQGDRITALDDVSLEIQPGALALITGASGSGKTTLIDIAGGLSRPSSGTVTVAGENLQAMSAARRAKHRARHIALVFQLFHLIPYLTALENVLLPTLALPQTDARRRAQALLEELGLGARLNHLPKELSAGERQRCALARALFPQPSVILADEPTGNLDQESAALVLGKLDACRKTGATVLLVSHQHLGQISPDVSFTLTQGRLVHD